MNIYEKVGIAIIFILFFISVTLTVLYIPYYNIQDSHLRKLGAFINDETFNTWLEKNDYSWLRESGHSPHQICKNLFITQGVLKMGFTFSITTNYIIISIILVWLLYNLRDKKT